MFTWVPVAGLRGELGCDLRRHTTPGHVVALCASGVVDLLDDGTALAVIGRDADSTVMLLTPTRTSHDVACARCRNLL